MTIDAGWVAGQITAHRPNEVLFWTGAGVSMRAPTNLPSGADLTRRVFESLFEPGALDTVLAYHQLVGWRSATICERERRKDPARTRLPRLETVLGAAAREDPDLVRKILDDVRTARPGWAHRFFAAHVHAGGRHLTANFDRCVETAHAELYGAPPGSSKIHHFHGMLDAGTGPGDLGATLAAIERGFLGDARDDFVSRLTDTTRLIVIVGYSGSDFFDVDVAVAGLDPGSLAGRKVLWISHSDTCGWHEPVTAPAGGPFADPDRTIRSGIEPDLAGHLRRAGADVTFVCGSTTFPLVLAQRRWGLDEAGRIEADRRRVRRIVVAVPDRQRRTATFHLYRGVGLIAEVDRMLRGADDLDAPAEELHQARSDLLWEDGRYGDVRRFWVRRRDAAPALRAERIGAALWTQGRLLPALVWLQVHRRRHLTSDPDGAQMLAETQGRVIEHMTRTPDLALLGRWLAPRGVRMLGAPAQSHGLHLFRRRSDLSSSLLATSDRTSRGAGAATESGQWFAEAGNIHAALSFQHRSYRDSYRPDIADAELADRYLAQRRRAQILGSTSATARVLLLPGAARVFTTRQAVTAAFTLQFGWWHRTRMISRFALLRLRRRLTR